MARVANRDEGSGASELWQIRLADPGRERYGRVTLVTEDEYLAAQARSRAHEIPIPVGPLKYLAHRLGDAAFIAFTVFLATDGPPLIAAALKGLTNKRRSG